MRKESCGFIRYSSPQKSRFKIRIADVIEYLTRLEDSPESLLTPLGIFSSGIKYRPKHRIVEPIDSEKFMKMLKKKWSSFPDVLTVGDVIKLTGYCQTTISKWISKKKLFGLWYHNRYLIPKDRLIEYMTTKAHRIRQKSNQHMGLIHQYYMEYPQA